MKAVSTPTSLLSFPCTKRRSTSAAIIDGAIALNPGVNVKRKKILLVDDVCTTGATSNECAKVLKRAQSSKIFVLTFATGRFHAELY